MSNFKKIFSVLFAVILAIGMLPIGTMAEAHSEHSFTIPTSQAGSSSDEPLITIGTISDVHVDYGLQGVDPYVRQAFKTAMNTLKNEKIDVLLVGGDMTSDNEDKGGNMRWDKAVYDRVISQFKTYATAASTTGKTLWACGNHDYEVGQLTGSFGEGDYSSYYGFVEMMIQTNGQPKDVYDHADDGGTTQATKNDWLGAHYVINGFDFIIINARAGTWQKYSAGTLNWLDKTLESIGSTKTVFVLGHYPLYTDRGVTNPGSYGIRGEDLTAFNNVMNKYKNAIYLYGHNHGTANGAKPWIQTDVFERITHYDANGNVVNTRIIPPSSYITAFMGSAGYYDGVLAAADPAIIQAMTITVYKDRIEFKMINCGAQNGGVQEPRVYVVERDVLGGGSTGGGTVIDPADIHTIPTDLTTTTGWSKNNFSLHYMDVSDSVLKNDWKQGSTYVNLQSGGHVRGTFDKRAGSVLRVFPEVGKSAVVVFTAPKDGTYRFEASVASVAKTGGGGNKQVVFSVMKDGVIYDITQPNNKDDYSGILSGNVDLKKGEKLYFVADHYVKFFNDLVSANDYKTGWLSGYYSDLTVARIGSSSSDTNLKSYKFDPSALNFTSGGFSLKKDNYSVVAIDYSTKKVLTVAQGKTTGDLAAALYNGNVTIAYRNADSKVMYGPFGSGNSNKNIASAIAFTAPERGLYNLTALLNHAKDYDSASNKTTSIVYEVLDSKMNVVFSGSTANLYTAGNVTDTYSRVGASVFLNKSETMYLVIRAASEANDLASDAMATEVVSLDVTALSIGCQHSWDHATNKCTVCGETCSHKFNDGTCSVCKKPCTHTWKNGACSVCKKTCAHTSYVDGKCSVCKTECQHDWMAGSCMKCHYNCKHSWKDGKCSVCGSKCSHDYGNDSKCDKCGYVNAGDGTTDPSNTTNPSNTTKPSETTDPTTTTNPGETTDNGNTTKPSETEPSDTTVPDNGAQNNGGNKDNTDLVIAIIIGVASVAVAAVILVVFSPKKAKK